MKIKFFQPLSLVAALFGLSGCVATSPMATTTTKPAQEALMQAMAAQSRQSFGYRTDFYVSNSVRENALAAATDKQLTASANIMQSCEDSHDAAYIALTKKLMAEQDVAAKQVEQTAEHQRIKEEYLQCIADQQAILNQGIETFDADKFFSENKQLDARSQMDLLFVQLREQINQNDIIKKDNQTVYELEHDGKHTALDVKKAKLLRAYLLKPSTLSIAGNYQPMLGMVSFLPSFGYQTRNFTAYANQPLYLDLKKGVLYLWADNLAMLYSETLDKAMGNQWQNKWLAINLNDDSLPDNFGNHLLKMILDAKKQSFLSLPVDTFDWVQAEAVLAELVADDLPDEAKKRITSSSQIIRSSANAQQLAYARYIFVDTLYQNITREYPELISSVADGGRSIADGETLIELVNANQSTDEPIEGESMESIRINAKLLVQFLLNTLQQLSSDYQLQLRTSPDADLPSYQPFSYYGLTGNRINWIYQRQYWKNPLIRGNDEATAKLKISQPLKVDSFTNIGPVQTNLFDRLPASMREPNASNTINFIEYNKDLVDKLQNSNDKYLKAMVALIMGQSGQAEDDWYFDEDNEDGQEEDNQEGDDNKEQ